MSELYNRIEALGKAHGYKNITVLCATAGVPRATMSELNSGRSKDLSKPTAQKFADLLGVTLDDIYGNEKIPANGEDEIKEYLQILRERPETRMLLQYSKGVGKKEIEAMAEMMKKLRGDDA